MWCLRPAPPPTAPQLPPPGARRRRIASRHPHCRARRPGNQLLLLTAVPGWEKVSPMWNRLVTTKRRWGYMVWGIAVALILASECIAAFDRHLLPFPTISDTTGHVERLHHWFKLIVVLVLVFP